MSGHPPKKKHGWRDDSTEKVFARVAIHQRILTKIHPSSTIPTIPTGPAMHAMHLAQGLEGEICPFRTGIAYSAPHLGQTSMGWNFSPGKHMGFSAIYNVFTLAFNITTMKNNGC